MNVLDVIRDIFALVPDPLQPLIIAAIGAIPFVEGEGAAAIGILGGINSPIAVIAGIVGNFCCVAALVLTSSSARKAVVSRRRERDSRSQADKDLDFALDLALDPAQGLAMDLAVPQEDAGERKSRRWEKFRRAFERYGVPGVSLLGPLLLPTHFTATMLAASGVGRARILFWQAIAIVGWTVAVGLVLSVVISVVR